MTPTAQGKIDFSQISRYQKRRFVPEEIDLKECSSVVMLYERLLIREITSDKELESWILDRSELEAALDQEGSILYILMTCQTDDAKRVEAYQAFIQNVVPVVKPLDDRLNKKYVELASKLSIDEEYYDIYNREIRSDLELFVEENVPLQTEVDMLSQEYQSICGAMTVTFKKKEWTLPEMGKFLLDPDRSLREEAFRASACRRLQEKEKLDTLFDKMLICRNKIAKNAGFDNFCDYKFKSLHRFDYTPEHCREYHQTIEEVVVPLWAQILEQRKDKMNLDPLRPWDTSVDCFSRPPLKPFEKVEELIEGCQEIFKRVDPELGNQFDGMYAEKLLDLDSRKGKAPGGYQSALSEARKPFIFMNAVGVDDDIRTLLHEGGHAFHSLACSDNPLLDYRHGPMEFNEVASMGMELLAGKHLDVFYNKEDYRRSYVSHLEGIIFTLVWVATIDAFQHWIYENPSHSAQQRREQWMLIRKRFSGGVVNWDGLEEEHSFLWHRQLHIFEVPFYYIEYGIAQLGALQLWLNSKKDFQKALGQYRKALSLGGSRPLPQLFETAGLQFDFSKKTIAPLVEAVESELNQFN